MKAQFLALQVSLGEETYKEDLPVAVVLRVDATLQGRVAEAIWLMRDKNIGSVVLDLGHDELKWIRTVGYDPENRLAPIPGWMDEPSTQLRTPFLDDVMELEVGGTWREADYRSDCVEYANADQPLVEPGAIRLSRVAPGTASVSGIEFTVCGETNDWSLSTFIHSLDHVSELFPMAAPPAATHNTLYLVQAEQGHERRSFLISAPAGTESSVPEAIAPASIVARLPHCWSLISAERVAECTTEVWRELGDSPASAEIERPRQRA